jgi:thiamine biosynthesis lipoprotein ApbE
MALTNRVNVIVLARDGTTSDALSTAAGVLGAQAGLALVERFDGVEARIEELGERGVVLRSTPFLAPRSSFLERR